MATRLNRFSLPVPGSTRARVPYSSFGKNFVLLLLLERYGITVTIPRSRQASRFAFESYSRSVIAARGLMSGQMSSDVFSCALSLTSPPVGWKAIGRPAKSVLRWILHENPPRDRPRT
jgi:hypothetical protein